MQLGATLYAIFSYVLKPTFSKMKRKHVQACASSALYFCIFFLTLSLKQGSKYCFWQTVHCNLHCTSSLLKTCIWFGACIAIVYFRKLSFSSAVIFLAKVYVTCCVIGDILVPVANEGMNNTFKPFKKAYVSNVSLKTADLDYLSSVVQQYNGLVEIYWTIELSFIMLAFISLLSIHRLHSGNVKLEVGQS